MQRRTLLATLAGTAAATAGCLDGAPGTPDTGPEPSESPDATPTREGVAWRFGTDAPVRSRPTVADGTVYVAGGRSDRGEKPESARDDHAENVYALDASDGSRRWRYAARAPVPSRVLPFADGTVATVGWSAGLHGVEHRLVGVAGGERRWRSEPRELFVNPLAVGAGAVYVGMNDDALAPSGHPMLAVEGDGTRRWSVDGGDTYSGALAAGTFLGEQGGMVTVARDPATGTERWRVEATSPNDAPLVAGGTVYVGSTELRAVSLADGTERWRYEEAPAGDGVNFVVGGVAVEDGVVSGANYGGGLFALDAATGERRWRRTLAGEDSRMAPALGEHVYLGDAAGHVYAFGRDGTERWRVTLEGGVGAVHVTANGLLVETFGEEKRGALHGLDPEGERRWSLCCAHTRPAVDGDRAYVGTADGVLALEG